MQRLTWLAAVALAVWLAPGGALAGATPAPEAPEPALCRAVAPSFAEIEQIMATPAADASPTPTPAAAATPASSVDANAITAVVRELIACFNAGEPLRAYGLYTNAYLRHLLSVQGAPKRAAYNLWAVPEPLDPDRYTQIVAIRNITLLDNGEIRALVTLRYAAVPVPKTFAFEFANTLSGWRISAFLGEINFSLP